MRPRYLAFLFAGLAALPAAEDAESRGVQAGLDLTLEASTGWHGNSRSGDNTQALTVAHAGWQHLTTGGVELRTFASVLNHAGDGPTERHLGDFLAASNIEACSSTRLYSWWAEAARDDWSLRIGALLADEEFSGTTAGGQFINSAFGWPAFISANTVNTGPAFYVAALGVRVERKLSAAATWRAGIYDGDTFDSPDGDPHPSRHGLRFHVGGAQGWFLINELAWAAPDNAQRFKVGAWVHTGEFADTYFDDAGRPFATSGADPRSHRGDGGAYGVFERTLAGRPGAAGHIDFFVRLGGAAADRNTLDWALDTGIAVTGPLPSRPTDVLALGLAHAHFSPRVAATARLLAPADSAPDFEQVVEASYTMAVNDHLTLKPDVQWIRHPGGTSAPRDACLFTLRLLATF